MPLAAATTLANTGAQLALVRNLAKSKARPGNLRIISLVWPATAILGVPDFVLWMGLGDVTYGVEPACAGMSGWWEVHPFSLTIRTRRRSMGLVTVRPSRLDRWAIEHLRMRDGGWLP